MDEQNQHESAFSRLLGRVPCDDRARDEHRDALRERALAAFDATAGPAARLLVGSKSSTKGEN